MYGKLFSSTFTGSMMASGPSVFAVWSYVIANVKKSRLELNPIYLAAVIGDTPENIQGAIDFLCAPDPNSRSPEHEGRRLIKEQAFQYFVPNHAKYSQIKNEDDRREYNRIKQQEHRARVKQRVNDSQLQSTQSAHVELDAELDIDPDIVNPKSDSLVQTGVDKEPVVPMTVEGLFAQPDDGKIHRGGNGKHPPCPYYEIIEMYHKTLPELPRVQVLSATRKKHLEARHRDEAENDMDQWQQYFEVVRNSDFLMGRTTPGNGRLPFRACFDWLINQSNFIKVAEGNYQ